MSLILDSFITPHIKNHNLSQIPLSLQYKLQTYRFGLKYYSCIIVFRIFSFATVGFIASVSNISFGVIH